MNFNPYLRRMIETVSFNPHNFVTKYDKRIFSDNQTFTLLINNRSFKITVSQTKHRILQDYSIFSMSDDQQTIQLVVKCEDIHLVAQGNFTKKDWMTIFTRYIQTTQQVGTAVNQSINYLTQQAIFLRQEKARIQDKEVQVKACKKADELAAKFCSQMTDLDKEMSHCGLSSLDIDLIKKYSAGSYDVTDFFDRLTSLNLTKQTTIIGLNHKDIIPGVLDALECEDYMDAYMRIFNDFRARDNFLEELTKEKHPIIFLVPHKLFGSQKGVTASEMEWLLKNPQCMGQVHFVFRAYKTYSAKVISALDLTDKTVESYKEHLTARIFQQIKAKNSLPTVTFDSKAELHDWSLSKRKFEMIRILPFEEPLIGGRLSLDEKDEFAIVPFTRSMSLLSMEDALDENVVNASSSQAISLSKKTIKSLKANRAIFFIGGSGSGKGTIRELIQRHHLDRQYVIIDPDVIKERMFTYQEALSKGIKSAATEVHEKSVKYATQLLIQTIHEKRSFIYDSTGSRFWIYEEQMQAARNQGMFVELIYVDTALENCLTRSEQRGIKTGRFIPKESVISSNKLAKDAS